MPILQMRKLSFMQQVLFARRARDCFLFAGHLQVTETPCLSFSNYLPGLTAVLMKGMK